MAPSPEILTSLALEPCEFRTLEPKTCLSGPPAVATACGLTTSMALCHLRNMGGWPSS